MAANYPYLVSANDDREKIGRKGFSSDGGDGIGGDMEVRVKALEDNVSEIKLDMKALIKEVAEMKGRVMAMPTTWQLVSINAAMLALVIAGGGIALTILRFIEAAPKP